MSVRATIVVSFGDGADSSAFVLAELDRERNVDSAGNEITSFAPGDLVYFVVQHGPELRIGRVAATHGGIVDDGPQYRARTDRVSFAAAGATMELSAYPSGAITWTWYAGDPASCGAGLVSGRTVRVSGRVPCLADVSYQARVRCYHLETPDVDLDPDESWPIEIHIYMEAA